uniref:Centrosomal protein of 162 kDa n=1 Tax=Macrostomum lignano TaxID=282301 RepID=A0A1I8FAB1_9PLAT
IEDKETQLKDYQNRLEQGKKKYDSLKQLAETQQQRENEESVRAQLAELKTQNDQLAAKLARMEKEKAAADRSLQVLNEGLKLREEHISEQDESMQTLQRKLVDADREFERLKGELHLLKTQFTSVREKSKTKAPAYAKSFVVEPLKRPSGDRQLDELRQQLAARPPGRAGARTRRLDGDLGEANRRLSEAEAEAQAARQQAADWGRRQGPARRRLAELTAERAQLPRRPRSCGAPRRLLPGSPQRPRRESRMRRGGCEPSGIRDRAETALLRRDLESIRAPGGAARETGQGEIASHWSSTGDLPTATRVRLRHLQLVERIYLQQTHEQVTLQLQLEAYQREVDEFRRLYTEAADRCRRERDAWEKQREALEASAEGAKMPKSAAAVIQRQPIRVGAVLAPVSRSDPAGPAAAPAEAQLAEQRQKHSELVSRLSKENRQLLSRVSSSGSGCRGCSSGSPAQRNPAPPRPLGRRRLDWRPVRRGAGRTAGAAGEQERRVERQRKEAAELAGKMAEMRLEQLERWAERLGDCGEGSRKCGSHATRLQRESTEWRVRAESLQETLAKESQRWVGERVSLQFASQQLRLVVDQWLDRFQGAVEELRATLQVIVDEIGKYKLRGSSSLDRSSGASRKSHSAAARWPLVEPRQPSCQQPRRLASQRRHQRAKVCAPSVQPAAAAEATTAATASKKQQFQENRRSASPDLPETREAPTPPTTQPAEPAAAPAPSAKRRFYQGFDERLFSGDGGSKSSEQKKPSEQAKPKPQMQLKPVAAPSGGSRFGVTLRAIKTDRPPTVVSRTAGSS